MMNVLLPVAEMSLSIFENLIVCLPEVLLPNVFITVLTESYNMPLYIILISLFKFSLYIAVIHYNVYLVII